MRLREVLAATAVGVGVAGTIDEVVLHQLLHWHHFYDKSTSGWGLTSDGIFHVISTALLVGGTYALVHNRQRVVPREAPGWIVLAAGAFNLYDGTIQHKVLRLHRVREGVANDTPYDAVFLGTAAALAAIGGALTITARRSERSARDRRS
jgi:uncharacterized membrane protein